MELLKQLGRAANLLDGFSGLPAVWSRRIWPCCRRSDGQSRSSWVGASSSTPQVNATEEPASSTRWPAARRPVSFSRASASTTRAWVRRGNKAKRKMLRKVGGGDGGTGGEKSLLEHFSFGGIGQATDGAGENGAGGVAIGGDEIGEFPPHAKAAGPYFDDPIDPLCQLRLLQHDRILRHVDVVVKRDRAGGHSRRF